MISDWSKRPVASPVIELSLPVDDDGYGEDN